jgi:hypothetical protein
MCGVGQMETNINNLIRIDQAYSDLFYHQSKYSFGFTIKGDNVKTSKVG